MQSYQLVGQGVCSASNAGTVVKSYQRNKPVLQGLAWLGLAAGLLAWQFWRPEPEPTKWRMVGRIPGILRGGDFAAPSPPRPSKRPQEARTQFPPRGGRDVDYVTQQPAGTTQFRHMEEEYKMYNLICRPTSCCPLPWLFIHLITERDWITRSEKRVWCCGVQ